MTHKRTLARGYQLSAPGIPKTEIAVDVAMEMGWEIIECHPVSCNADTRPHFTLRERELMKILRGYDERTI